MGLSVRAYFPFKVAVSLSALIQNMVCSLWPFSDRLLRNTCFVICRTPMAVLRIRICSIPGGRPKSEVFRDKYPASEASIRRQEYKYPSARFPISACKTSLVQGVDMDKITGSDSPHRDNTGWSATEYRAIASYVYSPEATAPILQSLGAGPGDKVLDLGCGSGEVTAEIARLVGPDGVVAGVDSSEDMVNHYLLLNWRWILMSVSHRSRGPARPLSFQRRTSSWVTFKIENFSKNFHQTF